MSQTDQAIAINELDAGELPDYRPVCVPAMVGCVVGLFSFLALLHPVMWFWPLVALGINAYALLRLSASERMVGRNAALLGVFAALLFGTAAPLRAYTYQWLECRDARQLGEEWFADLREGNIRKAHQLSLMPSERKPDEQLVGVYEQSPDLRTGLDNYLKLPVVATLVGLGQRANVRFYQTESALSDSRSDLVEDVYAVTYDEAGAKKSFFVKLNLWRSRVKDGGPPLWRVQNPEGGYKPKGWE